ncbi:MAG: riboflavin biosynthesis protein RibF [Planctomycetota bacterium]|nr:riboflavin biosynthesis protein RibF [Planctomycetota bacterium]
MERIEGYGIPRSCREPVVAIGTFDGVHLGHQRILSAAVEWARRLDAPAGAVTFRRHPRLAIEGRAPDLITSLEHRLVLFERLGLDFAWILDFDVRLASLSAEEFAREYLAGALGARGLVMGTGSSIGRDRLGPDSPALREALGRMGVEVATVPPVLDAGGEPVSSTRIREAIWECRLDDAAAMLGRPVSVYGRVVRGDARGRRLGYPTANVDLDRGGRPPFGVYATWTIVGSTRYGSITNIGYRPTVQVPPPGLRPDLIIETHMFDFDGDLYGRIVEVEFVAKIRDERRFPDVLSLVEQIRRDEEKARRILEKQRSRLS